MMAALCNRFSWSQIINSKYIPRDCAVFQGWFSYRKLWFRRIISKDKSKSQPGD